ncbi:hypothetical protein SPSIL_013870 [Sporomusa silvacetica DSM 10669]|uniref:Apolipoprotein N-acyltransferase n=1 Tax=Sporomusa silvacetica DSM 10669 TaxID=1123289 RepID=A0ABZ3IIT5_9FIRM|nr:hypothetical protein [Sporomusa silvacetica]OZC23848.1 hypothetical protein SPSIL_00810 [Sporomusa silvacetica DSM 10669]
MSNQTILWGTLIIPWLTLFFLPREDIKRFMPAGLLTLVMTIIASEVGVANGWWYFRETTYPLAILPSFYYGLYPITPMWVLKYTYGRFWLFFLVEIFNNAVYIFIIFPWFASRGILDFPAKLLGFIFTVIMSFAIYSFQMWQEGVFDRSEKTEALTALRPAATKPLPKDQENKPESK